MHIKGTFRKAADDQVGGDEKDEDDRGILQRAHGYDTIGVNKQDQDNDSEKIERKVGHDKISDNEQNTTHDHEDDKDNDDETTTTRTTTATVDPPKKRQGGQQHGRRAGLGGQSAPETEGGEGTTTITRRSARKP